MANIYDMADTWNDGATTFTAIKMNVTNTASASGSLLMDLQVGGVSQFRADKAGSFGGRDPIYGAFTIGASQARILFIPPATGLPQFSVNFVGDTSTVSSFRIGAADPANADVRLFRDAANTLALRNSTNAQTFNIYNTYTDASNYERGFMKWNSNVLEIGTEAGGTGTGRAVTIKAAGQASFVGSSIVIGRTGWDFIVGTSANQLYFKDTTNIGWGGTTSSFPALKRSTTSLQARLADDSAFTNIQGKLTTETAYTAGVTTATGYIVLYDSTGTAYKVPAEAL